MVHFRKFLEVSSPHQWGSYHLGLRVSMVVTLCKYNLHLADTDSQHGQAVDHHTLFCRDSMGKRYPATSQSLHDILTNPLMIYCKTHVYSYDAARSVIPCEKLHKQQCFHSIAMADSLLNCGSKSVFLRPRCIDSVNAN